MSDSILPWQLRDERDSSRAYAKKLEKKIERLQKKLDKASDAIAFAEDRNVDFEWWKENRVET